MMSFIFRLFLLAFVLGCSLAGTGCSKHARMERRLAAGDQLIAAGDYAHAEEQYRAALQLVPSDPHVMGRIGIMVYQQGRPLSAYIILKGVLENQADDPEVRLTYGLACLSLARNADARLAAKKVLESQPDNADALLLLADTCVTTRDNEEARRLIEQLRDRSKKTAGHHVALGALLMAQRDEAGAEAEFRLALVQDPDSSAALAHLGDLFLARNDPKQAGEALKRAAGLSPLRAPRRIKYIDFLVKTGALADAQRELDYITGQAPDYVPAWALTMKLAFQQGNYERSEKAAAEVLFHDRTNYEALMQRAAIKLVKGDIEGVIAELKTVDAIFTRSPQVKYQLALAYLKISQPFRAEDYLQLALRLSPNYTDAALLLAEVNLQNGKPAETIAALTRLIEQHPQIAPAYVLLAKAYRAQGNQPKALALLKLLSAASPNSPEGPYLVGAILTELRQKAEAREALTQSIRIQENYWPALEMLVDLDLADQPAAAVDRVEGLVKKYPAAVQPWLLRAKVRLVGGDTDTAATDLLKAIELEPKMQYPYLLLARIYYQSNRVREARDKLAALAAQRPSLNALMMLGMLHTALKDYDAARANYEQAIAFDATFSPALNNLAVLYSEQLGQPEKAHDFAQRARDLAPNDPVVADTFGWILFRRGQYEGALRPLQLAGEKIPGDPEIQYHLGLTQYYLGQTEPARQSFRNALAAPAGSPVHEDASRRLAILALDPRNPDPSARSRLEAMARETPPDPVVLTRLAELETLTGAAKSAAEHYEAVLKINPGAVPVMMALLKLYVIPLPNLDRAHDLAKLVRAAAPNDGQITWQLGRLLFQAGDFAWAATLLPEAVRILPSQPELLFDLARTQYSVGRVAEAEAALAKILGTDAQPALREPAAHMASLIAGAKEDAPTDAVQTEARQVLSSDPGNIPALVVTALASERQADYKGAARIYQHILALDPTFVPALRWLAILDGEQLGDDPQAEALATKALQSLPDDPELNYECGVVNYRRGEYAKAVRFLQTSARQDGRHADTYLFLGLSHHQLKNFSEGKAELERALELKLPPQEETEARRVLDLLEHDPSIPSSGQ